MYLSYDTTNWSPKGKARARRALDDINPNSYLQSSSKSTTDDPPHHTPLTPSITSSSIVGLASLASHPSIGPTPQPRINALPTEILTSIFLLCLPTRSDIPTSAVAPLLLCHVCDYWRRLARATPFLWLDLDLGEVRPGIMRRRVVVRDDDDEEVMVNAYMAETLGDAPGTSTVDPTVTTNATSLLRDYSYSRLRTGQLKLHTLALPSITEHFASLSHPLPLRSLKLDVSRFRWDVKTDWERRTRSWVVERLVPEPISGETRRVTIHQYRYRNVSSPSIPGEEEEGYYYELISARDVLESVLFAGGGFVGESVGRLDVSIDDLDDLPRVQVRGSFPPPNLLPYFLEN
ncbi:hypothetical protein FA13DRAFT_1397898 [Coprinellus micaceus]|uniref:Uncharacterized protein n=1 Tax=Coprinellus micaceus TaxID=71717 RepID=A0A4Y7SPW8_COPMI|nr:hypothetical protein FA13DRAFT_1397898 [Coprinellus micaceus]